MSEFTEANRKAFNDLSSEYHSKPWQQKLSQQISDALYDRLHWIGVEWSKPSEKKGARDVRLLDYACGTGEITKALGEHVTAIRGIDISGNMVQKYNEAALSSGLKPDQATATVGDLVAPTVSPAIAGPEYQNFDIAVIGLGFHHFENPALAVKRLAERLKRETGVLLIIDFLPPKKGEPGHSHAHGGDDPMAAMRHTIKHDGFTGNRMRELFEGAGLENFGFDVLDEPAVMELQSGTVKRTLFFARGRKPPTTWGKLKSWVFQMQESAGGQLKVGR